MALSTRLGAAQPLRLCVCVWRARGRQVDHSHLLHYLHFVPLPAAVFPAVSVCHRAPLFLCAATPHAEYTNNPAMYRRAPSAQAVHMHAARH